MCGSTSGDWLLSDELEGLSLQPGVQHAQARGGAHRVWVDLLWLFVVRGKTECPRALGCQVVGVMFLDSRGSSRASGHGAMGFLQ